MLLFHSFAKENVSESYLSMGNAFMSNARYIAYETQKVKGCLNFLKVVSVPAKKYEKMNLLLFQDTALTLPHAVLVQYLPILGLRP